MGIQRSLDLLTPIVRDKCKKLQSQAERMGILIGWSETRRMPITQAAYYAQGRESLEVVNAKREKAGIWLIDEAANKRIITKAVESIHFFDCAADFHLLINGKCSWDTKADINEDDTFDYENVGLIAESLGFKWGGRFKFKDYAHIEFTGGVTIEALRAGIRPMYNDN